MNYQNALSENLQGDIDFQKTYYDALKQLFDKEDKYQINTSLYQAKIFHFPEQKTKYLLVKDSSSIFSIYAQHVSDYNRSKPFEYIKKALKENESIHETPVLKIAPQKPTGTTNKKKKIKEEDEIHEALAPHLEKAKKILGNNWTKKHAELAMKLYGDAHLTVETTSNAYVLKNLSQYLVKEGVLKNSLSERYLIEKSRPKKSEKTSMADLLLSLDFFFKVSAKHKLTAKKPFVFNDLDNKLWAQKNQGVEGTIDAIVLEDQNAAFYVVKEAGLNNYTVYSCDLNAQNYKAHTKLKDLVSFIEKTPHNQISLIDNVALKIENEEISFIDYSWLECFMLDVKFTRINLGEDLHETPDYPVDMQSYKYLKNYYHDRFGYSEFEFLTQAVLTLGGGFEYDKNTKSFINHDIDYIPELTAYEQPQDPPKFTQMNYCYPKKFGALNADWTKGVEYLVEVLKRDCPKPLASETQNKVKDVQKAIVLLEKQLGIQKKAAPKKKI